MAFLDRSLAAIVTLAAFALFPGVLDILVKAATVVLVIHIYDIVKNVLRQNVFNRSISPTGKAVFVTGCDSGFGYYLAQRLDQLGFHVFAGCLFPSGEGAKNLQAETSSKLQIVELDVASDRSVLSALDGVKKNLNDGKVLWAIVNNAGVPQAGDLDWTSLDELQKVFQVNTMGVIRVTKTFIPLLRESRGRIVNVTSLCGRLCLPGIAGYSMSKAAAVFFTTGLRLELAKFGIKAISIEPFFFKTSMTAVDSVLKTLQKTWDEAPEEVRSLYGEDYLRAIKIGSIKLVNRGSDKVDQVINCLVDAVGSEEPLSTYFPCYLPDKVLLLMGRILPPSVTEAYMSFQYSQRMKSER